MCYNERNVILRIGENAGDYNYNPRRRITMDTAIIQKESPMSPQIRKITENDRTAVLSMMREFYSSPAVSTNGSEEIFNSDIDTCLAETPYLEGYVFELNGVLSGYAMLAKSFSTEYGKPCIWIEDLYILKEYRGKGIGGSFIKFVKEKHPDTLLRLEVEEENEIAVHTYKKAGFDFFPYLEMKKEV